MTTAANTFILPPSVEWLPPDGFRTPGHVGRQRRAEGRTYSVDSTRVQQPGRACAGAGGDVRPACDQA